MSSDSRSTAQLSSTPRESPCRAEGEPNLNYLCAGYKAFFEHVDRPMRRMAALRRAGRPPSDLMRELVQRAPLQPFVGIDESAGAPQ